jgi:flagellar basal-body rod protein FlgG
VKTDGIASATSALRYWERKQEVTANNLANATTDGFKAERVFAQLMQDSLPVGNASTDLRAGTLRATGNPLDVALGGDGFFVVQTPQGERWTRGGAWQINADGHLVDADGNIASGEGGPIRVTPSGDKAGSRGAGITIDRAGIVRVNGEETGRLRVERGDTSALQHEGGTRFVPPADRVAVDAAERDVRQGTIEESNVNSVSTLVDLITIQRNYAFAQRVLTTLDGIRATIANDLAKPA